MIEYISRSGHGGRHLYNEDVLNLQELLLSFSHIFGDCGLDFVITGCNVTQSGGNYYVNKGFVWLDGKIRVVEKTKVQSRANIHIIPSNRLGDDIAYATQGITGPMFADYGTTVTNNAEGGIVSDSQGVFLSLIDTYFDHYALTKGLKSQTVFSDVDFNSIISDSSISISNTDSEARFSSDSNGNLVIRTPANYFVFDSSGCSLKVYNSSGQELHVFGQSVDSQIKLPEIDVEEIQVPVLETNRMSLNGVDLDMAFHVKVPDTGWVEMDGASNMYARRIYNSVYVAGRISYSVANNSVDESGRVVYRTYVKMPSSIPVSTNHRFVVRGDNSLVNNGCCEVYFGSDSYMYIVLDSGAKMTPAPRTIVFHFLID